MNEWESFGLILAAIYLSECFAWIPVGSTAFRSPWRRRSHPVRSGGFLANRRGFLLLNNPLPPLGQLFLCQEWPFSPSPWGLSHVGDAAGRAAERLWRYEEIQSVVCDGRSLRLNGQELSRCASAATCRVFAEIIDQLRRCNVAKRSALIERQLRWAHDVGKARRQAKILKTRTLPLLIACNGLFCYFFATLYIWIRVYIMFAHWQAALIALAGFLAAISGLLFSLHRRFHPWNRSQRWTHAVIAAVSPMAAIRAMDLVERDAFHRFAPLTVAAVLSPPAEFQELGRQTLAALTFRDEPRTNDLELERSRAWYRKRLRWTVADLLQAEGLDADVLLAPPTPSGPQCRSYCPLCRAQYSTRNGTCVDCEDIALRPFE